MGRTFAVILLAATSAAVAGCGGTGLLQHSSSSTSSTATISSAAYLARLGQAQARLAREERSIPRNARTPAALSRAISQLAKAIRTLARELHAITPPPSVARAHARLVAIVRSYAAKLERAARVARRPGGELAAARALVAATNAASREFSATVAQIDSTLGRSRL